MKKKITLFAAVFCYLLGNSQMVVKKYDGTEIHDGDVFTYNTINEDPASLKFRVHNTSTTESILAKIECTSISNSDGNLFEFCFGGNCFYNVFKGLTNPIDAPGYMIGPGSDSGDFDHFWNKKSESTTGDYPMDYNFKIFMVDPLGNETGTPVNITYRYSGALAVNDVNQHIATIKNTLVTDILNLESKIDTTIQIVDISGKAVYTSKIMKGNNAVNLRHLNTGMYIVNIESASGKMISSKIIKK